MRHAGMAWLDRGLGVLIATLALGSVAWSAGITSDSFNGTTLNPGWTVSDPDGDDTVALTGDGWLQATLGPAEDCWESSRGGAVFFLTAAPGDDSYALETYVDMASTGTFMDHFIAGIVLVDSGNPDRYPFELSWGLHNSGSRWEVTLQRPGTTLMNQAVDFDAAYLRLERDGTAKQWSAYFKAQRGANWTLLGTVADADLAGGGTAGTLSVGLFCKTWGSAAKATAAFDYWACAIPGEAESPSPANSEDYILQDVILSWTPGEGAGSHTVYFGTSLADVNDASVDNPLGVLVSEDQEADSYDPECRLEFGQTYYWRVDETITSGNTLVKGAVWSFTIEPYGLPISGITATASSGGGSSMGPEKTLDGSGLDADDRHSTTLTDMWMTTGELPAWIQYDLGKAYQLHELWVWNSNGMIESYAGLGARDVAIAYSLDGETWAQLENVPEFAKASGADAYTTDITVDLGGITAQYVKLTINDNWGKTATQTGLSEVRFFYVPVRARGPEPVDGSVDVSVESDLAWRSGREATTHDVYWGTNPNALTLLDSVDEASYDIDAMNLGTTYYWRIDEVNEAEAVAVWEGTTWSFTTEEYLAVDDFESYTDNDGETIFQSWLDKWASAETYGGAQAGYTDPTFVETSIVHSGRQSMPLFYDNTSATFSETTLTLSQDWTANAVKSLSLWFRGTSGNTGELYVKINGAKVVYDGDAADIAAAGWLPWNIDLSTLGVEVRNIKSLTLGVAGTSSGLIYIDDIRLYAETPRYATPAEPDAANLVAYYALDGNAKDSSGNGYDGQVNGNPTYEEGVDGQAIVVDGIDAFIDLGKPSDWPAGKSPRSLSAWLMASSIAVGYRIPVGYGTPGTGQAMGIAQNGTTLYGFGYGDDLSVPNFWQVGVWCHICLTYDGTVARLYANGIEVAAGEKNWNLVIHVARIGQQINEYSEFWDGRIDEVRLYDRALTAEETAWLAGRRTPMPKAF